MKRLLVLLSILLISSFLHASTIEKIFYFDAPQLIRSANGDNILFDGCMLSARAGQPVLPWKSISLLLPPGEEAIGIEVIYGELEQLETSHVLAPYQPSRPLSEKQKFAFLKDEKIYASKTVYPEKAHGELLTSWFNGMGFALSTITPLQYIPADQIVYYAKEVLVRIETAPVRSASNIVFKSGSKQLISAERFAQNPAMIEQYKQIQKNSLEVPETDLLIVTKESYADQFDAYQEFLLERGFTSEIVTIETISSDGNGVDLQEKIRNFVIEKYNETGIHSLLLGGDVEIVPARGFYCYVQSGGGYETSNIPADLYYAALDGTWNEDNDDRWGEPGEDDLLPEIGVARMPFGNAAELDNMLNKLLLYQQQPVLGELEKPMFAGENLYNNPDTWGRDYLELLVGETDENGYTTNGIPESYVVERMYEYDGSWSGSDLINSINQGKQFVHHVGHASQTYVAHLYNSDITDANFAATNGIDHNFPLLHTHGCDCGAFDYNDCILEKMVLIENFAVAVIGNSRYGWFNEGQTEGPAAHLHREMTDAFYTDNIPYLGLALRESKIETAPWVTAPGQWEEGALRWNFYDLNILGDPMLSVWTAEPFEPEIDYTAELIIGLTEMTVAVSYSGEPLNGYRCHLRQNGEIIGVGETDADGNAVIVFDQALNETGEASLVVVGQNILPLELPVTIIPNEGPYLIWENMEVVDEQGNANGEADYGETVSLNIGIKNIGSENIENVMAQISVEDDWIVTVLESELEIGTIAAGETISLEDVFLLEISTFVPPDYAIGIEMVLTSGDESWTDHFDLEILIPGNHISHYEIVDESGNQNGMLDAGETVQFHVFGGNNGTSAGHDITISLSEYASEWLTIENGDQYIGSLFPGETFDVSYTIHVDEYAPQGTIVVLSALLDCPVGYEWYDDGWSWPMAIGLQIEDFETGDFTTYEWILGIANNWQIVEDVVYEGNFAAKSAQISDDQLSELKINMFVMMQDEISFYRKVSSESGYDYLKFYVDDMQLGQWSGEEDWELIIVEIPEGQHTLKWVYSKDGSVSNGNDCAWVDYITFPATATIMDVNTLVTTNSDVQIYPNPGSGVFWFDSPEPKTFDAVKLYQLDGKMVYSRDEWHAKEKLDISFLNDGLYVIELLDGQKTIRKKLIIQ